MKLTNREQGLMYLSLSFMTLGILIIFLSQIINISSSWFSVILSSIIFIQLILKILQCSIFRERKTREIILGILTWLGLLLGLIGLGFLLYDKIKLVSFVLILVIPFCLLVTILWTSIKNKTKESIAISIILTGYLTIVGTMPLPL